MKKFLSVMILLLLIFIICSTIQVTAAATTSEANIPSETIQLEPIGHVLIESNDLDELYQGIEETQHIKTHAHLMAEEARALGYPEDHPVIKVAQAEYKEANAAYHIYIDRIEDLEEELAAARSQVWESEYPTAAYVWQFLDEQGFNNYVKAGIMGNLMSECGGQTLDLNWQAWSGNSYYGIIQWSKRFYPSVIGEDLEGQCDFLMSNIESIFNTYGKNYKSNFKYTDFLNLTNEKEAALAFAKCYERCGSASYEKRKNNATTALKYFIGE